MKGKKVACCEDDVNNGTVIGVLILSICVFISDKLAITWFYLFLLISPHDCDKIVVQFLLSKLISSSSQFSSVEKSYFTIVREIQFFSDCEESVVVYNSHFCLQQVLSDVK